MSPTIIRMSADFVNMVFQSTFEVSLLVSIWRSDTIWKYSCLGVVCIFDTYPLCPQQQLVNNKHIYWTSTSGIFGLKLDIWLIALSEPVRHASYTCLVHSQSLFGVQWTITGLEAHRAPETQNFAQSWIARTNKIRNRPAESDQPSRAQSVVI